MYSNLVIFILIFITYCFIVYGLGDILLTYTLKDVKQNLPDRLYLITIFILGFYLMGMIYFISNLSIFNNNLKSDLKGNCLPIIFVGTLSTTSLIYLMKTRAIKNIVSKINIIDVTMILLGFIFSLFIVFNYNGFVNYGNVGDKSVHLENFTERLVDAGGFPIGSLSNIGMQCALLAPTVAMPLKINNIIYSSLFFGLLMMVSIVYLPYIFSKEMLGLNSTFSLLSSIMVVLFGVISLPLENRYRGFINLSTTFYHSDTQLFAVPTVMLSIYFLYLYYTNSNNNNAVGNNYLTLSLIFLSISYFLKPLGYVALAPIMTLVITLAIVSKRKITYRNVIDLFILLSPIITTLVYNLVFGYDKYNTKLTYAISSPGFLSLYSYEKYHPLFINSRALTLGLIIVVSLIGLMLPLIWGLFSTNIGIKNKVFIYRYIAPALVIALFFSLFVIETGSRMTDGNYRWGVALISCSMMPFIVLIVSKMKNKLFKYTSLTIIFLHLLGGAYHMIYLTLTGRL